MAVIKPELKTAFVLCLYKQGRLNCKSLSLKLCFDCTTTRCLLFLKVTIDALLSATLSRNSRHYVMIPFSWSNFDITCFSDECCRSTSAVNKCYFLPFCIMWQTPKESCTNKNLNSNNLSMIAFSFVSMGSWKITTFFILYFACFLCRQVKNQMMIHPQKLIDYSQPAGNKSINFSSSEIIFRQ